MVHSHGSQLYVFVCTRLDPCPIKSSPQGLGTRAIKSSNRLYYTRRLRLEYTYIYIPSAPTYSITIKYTRWCFSWFDSIFVQLLWFMIFVMPQQLHCIILIFNYIHIQSHVIVVTILHFFLHEQQCSRKQSMVTQTVREVTSALISLSCYKWTIQ